MSEDHADVSGPIALRWIRPRAEVAWLMVLALGVRLAVLAVNPSLEKDSVSLLETAAGGWPALLDGPHHPLPPALIALLSRWMDPETAAFALSVGAGTLAVWPLHALVRHVCGRHAATAAGVLYATLPEFVRAGTMPLTEGPYLPCFLACLSFAFATRASSRPAERVIRPLAAGMFGGLAFLCRPEGLLVSAVAVVTVLLVNRPGRRLGTAAIVAVAFALFAAPYILELSIGAEELVLSPKKQLARFTGLDGGGAASAKGVGEALRGATGGLSEALFHAGLILALVGAFHGERWRRHRSIVPRWIVVGTVFVSFAFVVRLQVRWGYGGSRHLLTASLLLLGFAGEGLHDLGGFLRRQTSRRRMALALAALLAVPAGVRSLVTPPGERGLDARRLGEALAQSVRDDGGAPGDVLVVGTFGEPLVAYYARKSLRTEGIEVRDLRLWGRHRRLLEKDAELSRGALITDLRDANARWIVLDLFDRSGSRFPGKDLLAALQADEVTAGPVIASGGQLAAVPLELAVR